MCRGYEYCFGRSYSNVAKDFYGIDKPSDDEKSEFQEDLQPLKDKIGEIEKKCKGDLAVEKADKDCEAAKEVTDKYGRIDDKAARG